MGGTTCHRQQCSRHCSHLRHRHICHHQQVCHCPLHQITRLKLYPLSHPQKLCRHTHPFLRQQAHLRWCQLLHPSPCLLPGPPQHLLVHLRSLVAWPHQQYHLHAWLHQQQQCPHHRGLEEGMAVACGVWPSRLCRKTSCRRQWTMLAARMELIARRLQLAVAASIQTTLHHMHHMHSIAIGRR